ncbi:MAG: HAD family phosphatase [Lachnospiraceae bacterium]|nr:HAD family phosphatase [Lachnospiraceae bacterium]
MLKDIKAVIFDLDGTLVDSMWIWKDIDIEYLAKFSIPLPDNLQSEIEGMSFSETAVYFKNRFQISDSVEEMKDTWNKMAFEKYVTKVTLKPGVLQFLAYCKESGIKLGIATSNSTELVHAVLKAREINSYFDCVVTGCEVERGKPFPDIYLEAAKRLSINPAGCLVFEDITPGIMAGKSAGMMVCAVADAYSEHQREQKIDLADYYIEDYKQINK